MMMSSSIENSNYFLKRVCSEYHNLVESKIFQNAMPNFYKEWSPNDITKFYDVQNNKILLKLKKLNDLVDISSRLVDRYNSFRFSIGSHKLQRRILLLTFITIGIGLLTFFGYEVVSKILFKVVLFIKHIY